MNDPSTRKKWIRRLLVALVLIVLLSTAAYLLEVRLPGAGESVLPPFTAAVLCSSALALGALLLWQFTR